MDQHEWVKGCLEYYRENSIIPGDPKHGKWHKCHYPVPECKNGTETILMLAEHHAVQGVLQSEEYQHPCIWGWEKHYLQGEYLDLYMKWHPVRGEIGGKVSRQNMREAGTLDACVSNAGRFGGKQTWDKKAGMFKTLGTQAWIDKCSKAGKIGCQKTNEQKWRCKETGYISTAAGVVRYQSLRNISTSPDNRERLE